MQKKDIVIINKLGLHARAAAKFVTLASQFESAVEVARNGQKVNGKSIMGVMMLAASKGTTLTVSVDGPDEAEAMQQIEALILDRFQEAE
ncbi:MAG: HPr family phosphocarrier protein [Gammaproteobacteria bacterium]|jgi:phosphocarrier protein|nr:HPr family phosphocarrier protein [Gammaproteobacteria bacterium]